MDRFQTISPIETFSRDMGSDHLYKQGSIHSKSLANYYAFTIDEEENRFELVSSPQKLPLSELVEEKRKESSENKIIIGINTLAFLILEDKPIPKTWSYNLNVSRGNIFQLPVNERPVLITRDGVLQFKTLKSMGSINISGKKFDWIGNRVKGGRADITIYGTFDISQHKKVEGGMTRTLGSYENSWIKAKDKQALLGFNHADKGLIIDRIVENQLNLYDYLFIGKCRSELLSDLEEGQVVGGLTVDGIKIDNKMSAHSLVTRLPKNRSGIERDVGKYLIDNSISKKVFQSSYRKSWSLVLKNAGKVTFLLIDARPNVLGQEGLNIYELYDFLNINFPYEEAYVCDAGQTSKICYINGQESKILGNLHYLDYGKKPPAWDGYNGRFVPGALLAYVD